MDLSVFEKIDQSVKVLNNVSIDSFCNVTSLTDKKCVSFVLNEKYLKNASLKENIIAFVVPEYLKDNELLIGKGVVVSKSPKYTFHATHNYLIKTRDKDYLGETEFDTVIGEGSIIDKSAIIASKNVCIGKGVVIRENVIIRENTCIGDGTVIDSHSIVGYNGCLVGKDEFGNNFPLLSAGWTKIGRNVYVGVNSAVARGMFPFEETCLGDYSQIGSFVDIAHNVQIGKNTMVLDQAQICGNTVVGENVHIAPQSIVSNRLKVGDNAFVSIGSVVVNNLSDNIKVAGNYAIDNSKFLLWHRNKLRVK